MLLSPSRSLVVGLAILCLVGTSPLAAQGTPAGTYHTRTVTLELTATGQARFSNSLAPLIVASYSVVGDSITFRDESGPAACPSGTGRYLWRLVAESLQFRLLSDPCEGRRTALATAWTRGPRPGPTVAELSRVVVTAQRQVEDVQRAPVSITVLSADVLRDAGVTRPQDLTYLTPGMQVGGLEGGNAMVYLRGVGNFAGNSLQDPTVTFNFDGVYIARQTSTSGLYYDLERIEVLKGPQGTLYGRNATGGAVNIVPRRPVLGEYTGEMAAEYGENNTLRMDGSLNVPLGDRAAVRVAGQRARHDAYMSDGTDDQNDWAGRVSGRFDVNEALALHVVTDYYDQAGLGVGATPLALGVDNRFGVSGPESGAYYGTQNVLIAGRTWPQLPGEQRANNHHWGVSGTMDWHTALGGLTVVSASRGSHRDGIGSSSGNLVTVAEHSRQNSVEARLASTPLARLETLVGAFYFDEEIRTPDGEFFRPWNLFNFSQQRPQLGVTSNAVFGRATWHVTDRFRTTLGARYTHESKYLDGTFESYQKVCLPLPATKCPTAQQFPFVIQTPPVVIPAGRDSASQLNADGTTTQGFRIVSHETAQFSRTTWRAALEYDVAAHALLYASYETGFKSGGFFFSNDAEVYQPEYVGAFTLGLKSRLFEDRVQANVELFDWGYKDQQVSKISIDSHGASNLRTENVGRATIRGVEATLEYAPLANTHLSADVQYLDAVYDSYSFRSPTKPPSGCQVSSAPPFLVDCSGRHAPYSPTWTHNLEAVQLLPLQRRGSLTAQARAHHQSETLVGQDFRAEQLQQGYWIVDGSLTLATENKRHSIAVFGQNLTDQTVMSNTFFIPFGAFPVGVLRPPRTLGVRVLERC
ncbi:MAG: TonB-dependent receptor [Gemmatimonadetes bacterium]|nr:MAG: TonB-dependent receptor [Gemmatimonadota bacterium]